MIEVQSKSRASHAPRRDILLLGGTTHANRGDWAMHQGRLNWLSANLPELRPIFLANNPGQTHAVLSVESEISPDACLAQRWNKRTAVSTLQRLQCLLRGMRFVRRPGSFGQRLSGALAAMIPGNGSMNSLWWHDWLYVKAAEVWCAQRAGVPVLMTSQGIGPTFSHWLDRWVARHMFNACQFVGVRDGEQSINILQSIGASASNVFHTGDDALLVRPDGAAVATILGSIPRGRMLVGVNVRDSHTYGPGYAKPLPGIWAAAFDLLITRGVDAHFVFLPISYDPQDDDRVAAHKVAEHMVHRDRVTLLQEDLGPASIRGLAAGLHVGAGVSYHFLLFCLASGVPAIGLWQNPYYEHKQSGLFRLYGQPESATNLASRGAEGLYERLRELIDHRSLAAGKVLESKAHLEQRAAHANGQLHARLQAGAIAQGLFTQTEVARKRDSKRGGLHHESPEVE